GGLPELEVARGELEDRGQVATAAGTRTLSVGAADQPPAVDGRLDDPCWRNAGVISEMEDFVRVPGTQVQTTIMVCADRDALYFGFDCREPATEDLQAATTERDGPVWRDDSVELFLDTNRDLHTYYQIIVNPRGVFFDQDTGEPDLAGPKWDGPITVATQVLPDRWTAEVKLEFTGLRLAEAGRTWGANFARTSMRGGRSCYTWVKVGKNFGEPARFGTLVLPFDPGANVVTGRPADGRVLFWGEGTLRFEIVSKRDAPVDVRISVTDEDTGTLLSEERLTVQPHGRIEAPLRCTFDKPGEVRLRYDLIEEPAGRLLYTSSQTHTVPEPLTLEPLSLVSWLDEEQLAGTCALGVAEDALAAVSLRLSVTSADGAPVASATLNPRRATGPFTVAVGTAPVGSYELRAELVRDGQVIASRSAEVQRTRGPFSK
ncbi:MAG: hypothetical protein J7M38_12695, partial [Armatimonadetes bacterium]|nr:hypothetical protein [Armatimonadota bacterium]